MNIYGFVQEVIIGAIVLFSALYVLRKLMPKWMRARQLALATMLSKPSRSFLLRSLGGFLMPGESAGGGCGSGCSTCSTCASNPEAEPEVKPLEFQRHI
ncbi:DUF6587 family protein [Herminiimonas arsenitoxidans]|jgi:hypothetical protein|uniref:DUF6587 family protein n=1 Tax=Herminiimonas arsenitoxidans TaxID=1809410 RepID=UPI000971448B|nr:DUF6587 family protein [Herminiimonas arsenitoxidans]